MYRPFRWTNTVLMPAARRRVLFAMAGLGLMAAAQGVAGAAHAAEQPNSNAEPQVFVEQVARQALDVLKADPELRAGDQSRINEVVDEYLMPYVNFEKTTRLATGRYWRQASPEQQQALVDAFRGTLLQTYGGAFREVDDTLDFSMLPFRGDATADDVVVRTRVTQSGMEPAGVDYRLERTPDGWRVYDISVEGIWLIQNYRNQFATEIQRSGIDSLIRKLEERNV